MFKVNNKISERRQRRCSGVFILNFEHISHLFLVFLLLTLNEIMLVEFCHSIIVEGMEHCKEDFSSTNLKNI